MKNLFRKNQLTNNKNFVNENETVILHKVSVWGEKSQIVKLINQLLKGSGSDTLKPNDETQIKSYLEYVNTHIVKVFQKKRTDESLNNLHFDKYVEVSDDYCLLSFYVGGKSKLNMVGLSNRYSHLNWWVDVYKTEYVKIPDEYDPSWYGYRDKINEGYHFECKKGYYLDWTNYKYVGGYYDMYEDYIYPLGTILDTDETMLYLHPVHLGKIKIEELEEELDVLNDKSMYLEKLMFETDFENFTNREKQHIIQKCVLVSKLIEQKENEIDFIRNLWKIVNEETWGHKDENLSMRYRGIDPLSPLTDLELDN